MAKWKLGRYLGSAGAIDEISADGTRLKHIADVYCDIDKNGPLLAASPLLLEACQAMIEWDDREKDYAVDFNTRMHLCRVAFDKARAAIQAATNAT